MAKSILALSGIYAIQNLKNGKRYVGSAVDTRLRWGQHRRGLANGTHHSKKLQNSWIKHGQNSFEFLVLEFVDDLKSLIAREQFWINKFESAGANGYNMIPTAGSHFGVKQTAEHIGKRVAAHIGVKRKPETAEKIRLAALGRKQTFDHIENRVSKIRGRTQPREHILKAQAVKAANRLIKFPVPRTDQENKDRESAYQKKYKDKIRSQKKANLTPPVAATAGPTPDPTTT